MSDQFNGSETIPAPQPQSKLAPFKKPLIAGAALLGGGLLAMRFLKGSDLVKIDVQRMMDEGLYLNISGNDLVMENDDGKILYVVQYIEATDGGGDIDWRKVEALDICPEHTDYICLIMLVEGKIRHARYFVCKKA